MKAIVAGRSIVIFFLYCMYPGSIFLFICMYIYTFIYTSICIYVCFTISEVTR